MTKENIKLTMVAIVLIGSAIALLLGVILDLKHSMRMEVYAISHDCNWTYVGADNADDGYICK